ncbi:MAG: hypothetical protein H7288_02365 [Kineosporiaceae bacterium]|nr:hypothetical protein [Aeromicrobium sp.]
MSTAFQMGEAEREFTLGLPLPREVVPISMWAEILGATTKATDELLGYALGWAMEKERRHNAKADRST